LAAKTIAASLNPMPDFLKLQEASPSIWTAQIGQLRRDPLQSEF
jgi:hypothetical protein